MQSRFIATVLLALSLVSGSSAATKIVIPNDDGWATAQIRALYNSVKEAGYSALISAPALNKSGAGSSSTTPTPLTTECQFSTCPVGSPAFGRDATDPNINYVNAFPVDAARHGINVLAAELFGSAPDLVISGVNIGPNLGFLTQLSGTVGAACEAALQGIPALATSGFSGSQVSYTTLEDESATSTKAAILYSALVNKLVAQLLATPGPILPNGIVLNVNFAAITSCPSSSDYNFILTRIYARASSEDVETCGTNRLPAEGIAILRGCIATVSVMNATDKGDVDAATQAVVLAKLAPILGCL